MSLPFIRTVVAATVGGVAHLAVVEMLFRYLAHVPESLWPLAVGFVIMGAIEHVLRIRLRGNFGGILTIPNTK